MRLVAVLWSGVIGGAETFTGDLCRAIQDLGVDIGVVFVTHEGALGPRLADAGIQYTSLGLERGRHVLTRPRAVAEAVQSLGPDGALIPDGGFLAATLKAGGFRGPVLAVAHAGTVHLGPISLYERWVRPLDRALGARAIDVTVAVSDFALANMAGRARRLVRIYNGIDLDFFRDGAPRPSDRPLVIGYAGRLIAGKGVDVLLRAFAGAPAEAGARLVVAGEGPARPMLQRLAAELGLDAVVEFAGLTLDMPRFWQSCDIAVMPSDICVESFGMSAVEAMACSRPVVATAIGALPEVVGEGTGAVVPPGDPQALATALADLAADEAGRRRAGADGRDRCEQLFDIRGAAAAYLNLFEDVNAA